MPSRRNMMVGLGALTVGGGAVFGSGAFSSTKANRQLEVNVVTGTAIAEDFVDVVLRNVGGTETLDVTGASPSDFPQSGASYGNSGFSPQDGDVSLMENDVTIVFGPTDNELPPNSQVSYDQLITIVNDEGDEVQDFTVSFSVSADSGDAGLEFTPSSPDVNSGATQDVDVDVNTGTQETTAGTLTITINEA